MDGSFPWPTTWAQFAFKALIPLAAIGVFCVYVPLTELRPALAQRWSSSYANVNGKVLGFDAEHSATGVHGPVWAPTAHYEYTVGGVRYEGQRARYQVLPEFKYKDHALAAAQKRWRIGAEVRVFYDPGNPADSLLDNGDAKWDMVWWTGGFGGFVLLAFGYVFVMMVVSVVQAPRGGWQGD